VVEFTQKNRNPNDYLRQFSQIIQMLLNFPLHVYHINHYNVRLHYLLNEYKNPKNRY